MKIGVLGIAIASVALSTGVNLPAVAQEEVTPPVINNLTSDGTAPASVQILKAKIDAINSSRSLTGVDDVVKLYQAGVDKGVIDTYIRNSQIPAPTPKDLVYLHEQKIPEDLVKAIIEHGREVSQASQNATPAPAMDSSALLAPYGPTYNNYVYTVPDSMYGDNYTAPSSSVTIIPYNPSRTSYAADFNSYYWGSPYTYGGYAYWPYYGGYYGGYGRYYGSYWGPYRYGGYAYGWGRDHGYHGTYRGGGMYYRGRR